ncbi:tetratricopeptide repeat protein [candidate division KSB1 bacterium]|nr:tetratricopeptide repeat protein [candidate division KSB1 bacterium]
MRRPTGLLSIILLFCGVAKVEAQSRSNLTDEGQFFSSVGYVYRLERRLKEASIEYDKVLELDPPRAFVKYDKNPILIPRDNGFEAKRRALKMRKLTGLLSILLLFCGIAKVEAQGRSNLTDKGRFFSSVQDLARFYFERGEVYLDLFRAEEENKPENHAAAIADYQKAVQLAPQDPYYHNRLGYVYHLERRLKEASIEYAKVLELDPPQPVTAEEFGLILKYAPRVYTNPKEFFPLEDLTVVIHPDKPLIEYSFFWDDDIDYPGDNDPTDHEKVWIEYDPQSGKVKGVYTYFHRAILATKEAIEDANAHNQRARINVQWGGHGSLPVGWENIPLEKISVKYAHIEEVARIKDMRTRYDRHKVTTRMPDHPLAKSWPKKFSGSWEKYTDFSKYNDLSKIIKKKRMVIKSRWPNAVINQCFLNYQFYPKHEWPDVSP